MEKGASLGRPPYIGHASPAWLPVGYGGRPGLEERKPSGKEGRASPPEGRPAGCFLGNTSPETGAGRGETGA